MLLLHTRLVTRTAFNTTFRNVRYRSGRGAQPSLQMPAYKPQQSHRIAAKEFGEIPSDLGLLPNTFVMPRGQNLPSLFRAPRSRLQLELERTKRRVLDLRDKIVFLFLAKTKLRLFEPRKIAMSLHKDMYTAFAQGDFETLRLICGDGLFDSFKKRLMTRGKNRVEWSLLNYVTRPRIVSNKANYYSDEIWRRQVVVRIHSVQSLTKVDTHGYVIPKESTTKEVVEYIVVEKKKVSGVESPWFVWGTTNESTAQSQVNPPR